MVKKYAILLSFISLSIPALSLAAGFTAQVDRTRIGVNDSLHLQLNLSDSDANNQPDFSELEKSFRITAREQSSSQNIINGNATSTTGWNLTLLPTQPGQTVIPPISIQTNQGELKTQPIPIQVTEVSAIDQKSTEQKGISFVATAEKTELYKNERVKVNFRLNSSKDLRNLQIEPLSVKDAIAEQVGKARVQTRLVNGCEQQELVVSYLITPLKDGLLVIPSLIVHAEVLDPKARNSGTQDPFHSFFDSGDNDGAMAQMQQMMKQFGQGTNLFDGYSPFSTMKPVVLASKPTSLKILPAVAGMNPWLPATSLKISEKWSAGEVRAGEPLTRTLTTDAIGIDATQLPSFEEQLHSETGDYKVYPDQPKISAKEVNGEAISQRSETFTVIPQRDGEIKIPAVQLAWWDTNSRTQKVAQSPEKLIRVLPGIAPPQSLLESPKQANPSALTQPSLPSADSSVSKILLLTGAIFCLLIFTTLAYWFKRKNKKSEPTAVKEPSHSVTLAVGKSDLKNCSTIHDLNRFLQLYSESHWQLPPNSSLQKIFEAAQANGRDFDIEKGTQLSKRMEDALYANKPVNSEELKETIYGLVFKTTRGTRKEKSVPDMLDKLNPS